MRIIQATVPVGSREAIMEGLQSEGVAFTLADESSGRDFTDIVYVPVEDDDVSQVIEMLREAGVERDGYIFVHDAHAVVSEQIKSSDEEEGWAGSRLAREELDAKVRELSEDTPDFFVFTVLSSVLATGALLIDSPTVLVGAMVLAPVLGPSIASSVGGILGDQQLLWHGVKMQLAGLTTAVLSATAFGYLARLVIMPHVVFSPLEQIAEFSNPVMLTFIIAIAAGIAAALALTSGLTSGLIGVAVAAALVPPAAATGLGIAFENPNIAVGAGMVLVVNLLAINLMSAITLRLKHYKPAEVVRQRRARDLHTKQVLVLGVITLIVAAVVGGVVLQNRANTAFESEVRNTVENTNVGLIAFDVEYQTTTIGQDPGTVIVRVERSPPSFAERLQRRIYQRTGQRVAVVVFEASDVAVSPGKGPFPNASNASAANRTAAISPERRGLSEYGR